MTFFSSKNDVNVPVFHIRIRMLLGLSDPHRDPLVRGTDTRIRIRTKMSRILSTDWKTDLLTADVLYLLSYLRILVLLQCGFWC
jgi:hypothetical protein